MHPLLESSRRLALYLMAWIPLLALLVYVMWASGGMTWMDAAVVLAPSCLVYAFACLSPWYICGTLPLGPDRWQSLAMTFGMASTAGSLVLVGGAWLTASAVAQTGRMAGLEQRLHGHLALLFGMGVLLYLLSAGLHYAAWRWRHRTRRNGGPPRRARWPARRNCRRCASSSIPIFCSTACIPSPRWPRRMAHGRGKCASGWPISCAAAWGWAAARASPCARNWRWPGATWKWSRCVSANGSAWWKKSPAACQDCTVPALLLQPLVENAVKHGVAGMVEGGAIRLAVEQSGSAVSITLENGFDPEMPVPRSLGIGLSHVRRRLEVRYGENASFDAGVFGRVYRVVLRFPCESSIASSSLA